MNTTAVSAFWMSIFCSSRVGKQKLSPSAIIRCAISTTTLTALSCLMIARPHFSALDRRKLQEIGELFDGVADALCKTDQERGRA